MREREKDKEEERESEKTQSGLKQNDFRLFMTNSAGQKTMDQNLQNVKLSK